MFIIFVHKSQLNIFQFITLKSVLNNDNNEKLKKDILIIII